MILSQTSEYAIRAVSYIALRGNAPIIAKELAKQTAIPVHYLSKVLRKLVTAGILGGSKGHNGGFVLARTPNKIKIVDVLNAVEDHLPSKHCIFGWRMCNSKDPCILHHRWTSVNDSFQNWARDTTLAHIQEDAASIKWLTSFKDSKFRDPKEKGVKSKANMVKESKSRGA